MNHLELINLHNTVGKMITDGWDASVENESIIVILKWDNVFTPEETEMMLKEEYKVDVTCKQAVHC